jgi:hypothetical protein
MLDISTGALGIYAERLWNLNSLFDPDRTGTGHQPMGFDQYTPVFNRYIVKKVRYQIICSGQGLTTPPGIVCAVPTNNTTAITLMSEARELPHSVAEAVCVYYNSPTHIKSEIDLSRLTGRTSQQYMTDDTYASAVSGSPTELLILHVGIANSGGGTTTSASLSYLFEFDCDFYDPVQLGQS